MKDFRWEVSDRPRGVEHLTTSLGIVISASLGIGCHGGVVDLAHHNQNAKSNGLRRTEATFQFKHSILGISQIDKLLTVLQINLDDVAESGRGMRSRLRCPCHHQRRRRR